MPDIYKKGITCTGKAVWKNYSNGQGVCSIAGIPYPNIGNYCYIIPAHFKLYKQSHLPNIEYYR